MALTDEQQQIISSQAKHCLVVAGAGCGKTHTIVEFIRHRLRGDLSPDRFLLITFTRKAAAEMAGRLQSGPASGLGSENGRAYIGTFHAMAWRLLRQWFPGAVDDFQLLDEKTGQEARYEVGRKYIHLLQGRRLDMVLNARQLPDELQEVRNRIEFDYIRWKLKNRFFDFDDLLTTWQRAMSKAGSSCRQQVASFFKLIVVDEYQDTGAREMKFLQTFRPTQLLVVGDDWQSIYGFRQADLEYTRNFEQYFPGAQLYRLTTNYRSTKAIVQASQEVITRGRGLIEKKLNAHRPGRVKPVLIGCPSPAAMKSALQELLHTKPNQGGSWAVLCRTNRAVQTLTAMHLENYLPSTEAIEADLGPSSSPVELHIMTIHQAKGLEFDRVVIWGLDGKSLPHPGADKQEELRLLYVAMSRAKNELYILADTGHNPSSFLDYFGRRTKRQHFK